MLIYPAIDLKNGKCVRLLRGEMDSATVYNADPADQARTFEAYGFRWLHVVDLDGAIAGQTINYEAVSSILSAVSIPVQLGGGIRNMEQIESWIARGISRIVLGTAAIRCPSLIQQACAAFPNKIALGLDARAGQLAVSGWTEQSQISALDFIKRVCINNVAALIYTDINRDGALSGPNLAEIRAVASTVSVPVIASGGISNVHDLRNLAKEKIDGVIVGKAFYTRTIEPIEALAFETTDA